MICAQCGKEFDQHEPGAMPNAFIPLGKKVTRKPGMLDGKPFGMGQEVVGELTKPHPLCAHCVSYNEDGTERIWMAGGKDERNQDL